MTTKENIEEVPSGVRGKRKCEVCKTYFPKGETKRYNGSSYCLEHYAERFQKRVRVDA